MKHRANLGWKLSGTMSYHLSHSQSLGCWKPILSGLILPVLTEETEVSLETEGGTQQGRDAEWLSLTSIRVVFAVGNPEQGRQKAQN